jgi:hypothetical protein
VTNHLIPRGSSEPDPGLKHFCDLVQNCNEFHEMTGNVGDVILMHPFMLHSASRNGLRHLRIITNPPVAVKQPFNFTRESVDDYSLVELKTLDMLGKERLPDWKIKGEREFVVPERVRRQAEMKKKELERLKNLSSTEVPTVTTIAA